MVHTKNLDSYICLESELSKILLHLKHTGYLKILVTFLLTLMGEDAVESPKEMLGKEGDVYKLSIDTEPSGRNNLGCEGHLYIKHTGKRQNRFRRR